MIDPDTLDIAELRDQANLFDRWVAHKRQLADLIEISCFTTTLNAEDGTGRRGVDRLLALDPMAGLTVLGHLYARITMLALQVARDRWRPSHA